MLFAVKSLGIDSSLATVLKAVDILPVRGQFKQQLGVNLTDFNIVLGAQDALIPNFGFPVSVSRFYNDKTGEWQIGGASYLVRTPEGFKQYLPDGAEHKFLKQADGSYLHTTLSGELIRLEATDDGFQLTRSNTSHIEYYDHTLSQVRKANGAGYGVDYKYTDGLLSAILSDAGNGFLLEYDDERRVVGVTEVLIIDGKQVKKKVVSYQYQSGQLQRVEFLDPKKPYWIDFAYDVDKKLKRVLQKDNSRTAFEWREGDLFITVGENQTYRLIRKDKKVSVQYPDSTEVHYTLNEVGRITAVDSDSLPTITVKYTQDVVPQLHELRVGDKYTQYEYGRVASVLSDDEFGLSGLLARTRKVGHGSKVVVAEFLHAESSLQRVEKRETTQFKDSLKKSLFIRDEQGRVAFIVSEKRGHVVVTEIRYHKKTGLRQAVSIYPQDVIAKEIVYDSFELETDSDSVDDYNLALFHYVHTALKQCQPISLDEYDYTVSDGVVLQQTTSHSAPGSVDDRVSVKVKRIDLKAATITTFAAGHEPQITHLDVLKRPLRQTDELGRARLTDYQDEQSQVEMTSPGGLLTIRTADLAARLHTLVAATETENHALLVGYDKNGYIYLTKKDGQSTWTIRDGLGRIHLEITEKGLVTAYQYDKNNHQVASIQYATDLEAEKLKLLVNAVAPIQAALTALAPKESVFDRVNFQIYNDKNQLAYSITSAGRVEYYKYDDLGNRVKELHANELLTKAQLLALRALPPEERLAATVTLIQEFTWITSSSCVFDITPVERIVVDAEGYPTKLSYDVNGNVTEKLCLLVDIRHEELDFSQLTMTEAEAEFDALLLAHHDKIEGERWQYDGRSRLLAHVDKEGYLTTTTYHDDTNTTRSTRHATKPDALAFSVAGSDADETTVTKKNDAGEVVRIEHPNGLVETFEYDDDGRESAHYQFDIAVEGTPDYIATVRGKLTVFRKDGLVERTMKGLGVNLLLKANTEAEREEIWQKYGTHNRYNDTGKLIVVTKPKGAITRHFYNDKGQLSATLDAENYLICYQYNQFDEVVAKRIYEYPVTLQAELLDDADFKQGKWTVSVAGELTQTVSDEAVPYDEFIYTRDDSGRIATELRPDGVLIKKAYDVNGLVISERHYKLKDGDFELLQVEAPFYSLEKTYDEKGRPLTIAKTKYGLTAVTRHTYKSGRLKTTTDAEGNVTTFFYDKLGRLEKTQFADGTQVVKTHNAFRETSNTTTRADERRTTTIQTMHAGRRVVTTNEKNESVISQITVYGQESERIDASGIKISNTFTTSGKPKTTQLGKDRSEFSYDEADAVAYERTLTGVETTYKRDTLSRETETVNLTTGCQTHRVYHSKKRVTTTSAGESVTVLYDFRGLQVGRELSKEDEKRLIQAYQQDSLGEKTRTTIGEGEHQQVVCISRQTFHDELSHADLLCVTTIVDPDNLKLTSHVYLDKLGRKVASIDAEGRLTRFVLDCHGREVLRVEANGAIVETTYNASGQVSYVHQYATRFAPDYHSLKLSLDVALPTKTPADRWQRYVYDEVGNQRFQIKNGRVIERNFNPAGRVIFERAYATMIENLAVLSQEDLTALRDDEKDHITRVVYDDVGREKFRINASGYMTEYEYLANGRMVNQHRYNNQPPLNLLDDSLFSVESLKSICAACKAKRTTTTIKDGNGKIQTKIDERGYVTCYVYDTKSRSTQVIQPAARYLAVRDASLVDNLEWLPSSHPGDQILDVEYYADALVATTKRKLKHTEDVHSESYAYHTSGFRHQKTDNAGGVWDYVEDGAGREASILSPLVQLATVALVDGHLVPTISPEPVRVTTKKKFTKTNQTRQVIKDAESDEPEVVTHQFDEFDKPLRSTQLNVSVQNPDFDITVTGSSERDEATMDITVGVLHQDIFSRPIVKLAASGMREYFAYALHKQPVIHVDEHGVITENTYDAFGRVTSERIYAKTFKMPEVAQEYGLPLPELQAVCLSLRSDEDRVREYTYSETSVKTSIILDEVEYYSASDESPELQALKKGRPVTQYHVNGFDEITETRQRIDEELEQHAVCHRFADFAFREPPTIQLAEDSLLQEESQQEVALAKAKLDEVLQTAYFVAIVDASGFLTVQGFNRDDTEIFKLEYASVQTVEAVASGEIILDAKDRLTFKVIDGANRELYTFYPQCDVSTLSRSKDGKAKMQTRTAIPFEARSFDAHDEVCLTRHKDGSVSSSQRNALGITIRRIDKPVAQAIDSEAVLQLETHIIPDAKGNAVVTRECAEPVTLALVAGKVTETRELARAGESARITVSRYNAFKKPTEVQDPLMHVHHLSYARDGELARSWSEVTQTELDENEKTTRKVKVLRETRIVKSGLVATVYTLEPHKARQKKADGALPPPAAYTGERSKKNTFGDVVAICVVDADGEHLTQQAKFDKAGNQTHCIDDKGIKHARAHNLLGKATLDITSMTGDVFALSRREMMTAANQPQFIFRQSVRDAAQNIIIVHHPQFKKHKLPLQLAMALHHPGFGDNTLSWPAAESRNFIYRVKIRPKGSDEAYIDLGFTEERHLSDKEQYSNTRDWYNAHRIVPHYIRKIRREPGAARVGVELAHKDGRPIEFGELEFIIESHHAHILPGREHAPILEHLSDNEVLANIPVEEQAVSIGYDPTPDASCSGTFDYQPKIRMIRSLYTTVDKPKPLEQCGFAMRGFHFTADVKKGTQVTICSEHGHHGNDGRYYFMQEQYQWGTHRVDARNVAKLSFAASGGVLPQRQQISFKVRMNLANVANAIQSRELVLKDRYLLYGYGHSDLPVPFDTQHTSRDAHYHDDSAGLIDVSKVPTDFLYGSYTDHIDVYYSGLNGKAFDVHSYPTPDAGPKHISATTVIDGVEVTIFDNEPGYEAHPVLIGPFNEQLLPEYEIRVRNPQYWGEDFITLAELSFQRAVANNPELTKEAYLASTAGQQKDAQIAGRYLLLRGDAFPAGSYEIQLRVRGQSGEYAVPVDAGPDICIAKDGMISGSMTMKEHRDDLEVTPELPSEPPTLHPTEMSQFDRWRQVVQHLTPENYQRWQEAGGHLEDVALHATTLDYDGSGVLVLSQTPKVPVFDRDKTLAEAGVPQVTEEHLVTRSYHDVDRQEVAVRDAQDKLRIERRHGDDILIRQDELGRKTDEGRLNHHGEMILYIDGDGNETTFRRNARGHQTLTLLPAVTELGKKDKQVHRREEVPNELGEVITEKSATGIVTEFAYGPHGEETLSVTPDASPAAFDYTRTHYLPGTLFVAFTQTPNGWQATTTDWFGHVMATVDDKGSSRTVERNGLMLPTRETYATKVTNPDETPMPHIDIEYQYHQNGQEYLARDIISQMIRRRLYDLNRRQVQQVLFGPSHELYSVQGATFDALGDRPISLYDVNVSFDYYRDRNRNTIATGTLTFSLTGDASEPCFRFNSFDDSNQLLVHQGVLLPTGEISIKDGDTYVEGARFTEYDDTRGLRTTDDVVKNAELYRRIAEHDERQRFIGLRSSPDITDEQTFDGPMLMVIGYDADDRQAVFFDWMGDDNPEARAMLRTSADSLTRFTRAMAARKGKCSILNELNLQLESMDIAGIQQLAEEVEPKRGTVVVSRHAHSGQVLEQVDYMLTDEGKLVVMRLNQSDFHTGYGPKHTYGKNQDYEHSVTRTLTLHNGHPETFSSRTTGNFNPRRHFHPPDKSGNTAAQYRRDDWHIIRHFDAKSEVHSRRFILGVNGEVLFKLDYKQNDDGTYLADVTRYLYHEGQVVGVIHQDPTGDIKKRKDGTPDANPDITQSSTTVAIRHSKETTVLPGETARDIALREWGSEALGSLIAARNGKGEFEVLTTSDRIHLGPRPLSSRDNVRTHYVPDMAALYGSFDAVLPTLRQLRRKKKHKSWKHYLVAAVGLAVVYVLTAGAGAPIIADIAAEIAEGSAFAASVIQGAIIGISADVTSQAAGLLLGTQRQFYFAQTGKSALAAMVTAGIAKSINMALGIDKPFAQLEGLEHVSNALSVTAGAVGASNTVYHESGSELDHSAIATFAASIVGAGLGGPGVGVLGSKQAAFVESVLRNAGGELLSHRSPDWGMVTLQATGASLQAREPIHSDSIAYGEGHHLLLGGTSDDALDSSSLVLDTEAYRRGRYQTLQHGLREGLLLLDAVTSDEPVASGGYVYDSPGAFFGRGLTRWTEMGSQPLALQADALQLVSSTSEQPDSYQRLESPASYPEAVYNGVYNTVIDLASLGHQVLTDPMGLAEGIWMTGRAGNSFMQRLQFGAGSTDRSVVDAEFALLGAFRQTSETWYYGSRPERLQLLTEFLVPLGALKFVSSAGKIVRLVRHVGQLRVGAASREAMLVSSAGRGAAELPINATMLSRNHLYHPGLLSDDMAETFIGSRYTSYKLTEDSILYRAGSESNPFGQYFSFEKPVGELQVRVDKAILPKWPNGSVSEIDTGYAIKIPKGTVIHVGDIAPQGDIYLGGTRQVLIEAPWSLKGVEVVERFSLRQEKLWAKMTK